MPISATFFGGSAAMTKLRPRPSVRSSWRPSSRRGSTLTACWGADSARSGRPFDCLSAPSPRPPDNVEMQWTRACVQLRVGDFERGLAGYEIRFRRKETALGHFTMPLWAGESLADRTILVHTEQGFGDTVQLVRLLPMLAAQGARVWFSCPPEMMRLMA